MCHLNRFFPGAIWASEIFWKCGEVALLLRRVWSCVVQALATGVLTGVRRLLCCFAKRWPVQPTSIPAPSSLPPMAQPQPPAHMCIPRPRLAAGLGVRGGCVGGVEA